MTKDQSALDELIYIAKGANTSAIRTIAVKGLSNLISEAFHVGQDQASKDFVKSAVKTLTELLKHPDSAVVSETVLGL
jgi:hypothetical protein